MEVKDYGFEEAERYFDRLWNESVALSQDDINKIAEILKNKTFIKQVTPFTAYAYLLKVYLELHS
ncbi:MAG: hypothetical protein NZ845_02255 [Thermodesulfovibrio sp.]|nr:hypothetical protein [Thermodesulfovibrio sp.]MDW7973049.1 hypothetical protein [Thermodesulfovibrio sp.]